MRTRPSVLLLSALVAPVSCADAAELTGRVSVLGSLAQAHRGDVGSAVDMPTADEQSLRLMLDEANDSAEWSIHAVLGRQNLNGYPGGVKGPADLFRYTSLSQDWVDEQSASGSTRVGYEIDRLFYKHRFGAVTVGLGRQPIDWGTGRFWQPMNVFGAFAPTTLDTDFKPGIDGAILDWFPSAFSSLTVAYVLSPEGSDSEDSGAVRYRRQVGEQSEMTLLAGNVIGNTVLGASLEGEWRGVGWRIEGVHYRVERMDDSALFWIAGLDYQFDDSTLVSAEWYDNSRGATHEADLPAMLTDPLVVYRLQQHMSRRVLGVGLTRTISPLLQGSYTMLASILEDVHDRPAISTLHQLNLIYSVSNESDLLLSLLLTSGKGLREQSTLRSEFGHLPPSVTVRFRQYF